jgi:hypothetical protein
MIYYMLFGLAAGLSFMSLDRRFPDHAAGVLFFSIVLGVVGFRYASVDYFQYEYIYDSVTRFGQLTLFGYQVSATTPVEPAFALLILVQKTLYYSFPIFIFLVAILSLTIKFHAFRVLSPFLVLSGLVYLSDEYFWKDLGQIRNAFASAIVLWSVVYVFRGQAMRFIFAIGVASTIHAAAIVAAPLYFARRLQTPLIPAAALIASVFVAAAGGIGLLLPELAVGLGMDATSRLVKYAETKSTGGITAFGGTFWIHVILCATFLILYRQLVRVWPYNRVLIPMYVGGTALMFSLLDYAIIAGRIREMLCVPAVTILLPSILLLFRGQQRLIAFGGVLIYCLIWFNLMVMNQAEYQSILLK